MPPESVSHLLLLDLLPAAALLMAVTGLLIWIWRKAGGIRGRERSMELDFERSLLEGRAAAAVGVGATSPIPTPSPSVNFTATNLNSSAANSTPIAEPPNAVTYPLGQEVIAKLQAGGLLEAVEGPLRSPNAAMKGTLLRLKKGKHIIVLEAESPRDSAEFDALFRRFDAVVVPGATEPIVMKRFQSLIGDLISL